MPLARIWSLAWHLDDGVKESLRDPPGHHQGSRLSRLDRVLAKVLGAQADAGIRFRDLCVILERLGFSRRVRGSHHIFSREGVTPLINLQDVSGQAIPYQVRQVRRILREYGLISIERAPDAD